MNRVLKLYLAIWLFVIIGCGGSGTSNENKSENSNSFTQFDYENFSIPAHYGIAMSEALIQVAQVTLSHIKLIEQHKVEPDNCDNESSLSLNTKEGIIAGSIITAHLDTCKERIVSGWVQGDYELTINSYMVDKTQAEYQYQIHFSELILSGFELAIEFDGKMNISVYKDTLNHKFEIKSVSDESLKLTYLTHDFLSDTISNINIKQDINFENAEQSLDINLNIDSEFVDRKFSFNTIKPLQGSINRTPNKGEVTVDGLKNKAKIIALGNYLGYDVKVDLSNNGSFENQLEYLLLSGMKLLKGAYF